MTYLVIGSIILCGITAAAWVFPKFMIWFYNQFPESFSPEPEQANIPIDSLPIPESAAKATLKDALMHPKDYRFARSETTGKLLVQHREEAKTATHFAQKTVT